MQATTKKQQLPLPAVILGGLGTSMLATYGAGKLLEGPLKAPVKVLDKQAQKRTRKPQNRTTNRIMHAMSGMGEPRTLYPLAALFVGLSLWQEEKGDALSMGLALAGSAAINGTVQKLVGRARPRFTVPRLRSSGSSFPSQHMTMSVATYGMLAYLVARRRRKEQQQAEAQRAEASRTARVVWATAIAACSLIGFSRVYLGVHHPTDILGGLLAGSIWLASCAAVRNHI